MAPSPLCAALLLALCVAVSAWPYDDSYNSWRMARTSRRSHHCTNAGGKCFSTTECCRGFVCAAFDDYYGRGSRGPQRTEEDGEVTAEIPGFCVKEKDLQPCFSRRDCDADSKCMALGRDGEMYCVRRPEPRRPSVQQEIAQLENAFTLAKAGVAGGVGSDCEDSSDCNAFDKSSGKSVPLCCQRVSRGRSGVKVMCDHVTPISRCIGGA